MAATRLTRAQVREVDRLSIEKYHVPGVVLMENAARAVVDVAVEMVGRVATPRVLVVCGGGNNGGDGLAVARHLHNRGFETALFLTIDPAKYVGDALVNWRIVEAMGLPRLGRLEEVLARESDLVVDAMFGTGLASALRPAAVAIVEALNRTGWPTLAVDLPSGLDCDAGEPLGACVRAMKTVTFVAEKAGFANPASKAYTGDVFVGDIGCPREAIEEASR